MFGGIYSFRINSDQTGTVAFDRNRTFLNERQYYFAAFAPELEQTEPVHLTSFLTNTTNEPAQVELTWQLYRWDQQRAEHLLSTETQTVSVDAGDTIPVRYIVTDTNYPVYLLSGTAKVGDMTSRINVRFVREGLTKTRLNFPGVTSYPLTPEQAVTLFACAHNTSNVNEVPGGRIELELRDHNNRLIHSHTYEGVITGAMMGTADTFVPNRTYDTFTLTARLFQDNREVESVTLQYDCVALGGGCLEQATDFIGTLEQYRMTLMYGVAALTVLILLGYLGYLYRRRSLLTKNF